MCVHVYFPGEGIHALIRFSKGFVTQKNTAVLDLAQKAKRLQLHTAILQNYAYIFTSTTSYPAQSNKQKALAGCTNESTLAFRQHN